MSGAIMKAQQEAAKQAPVSGQAPATAGAAHLMPARQYDHDIDRLADSITDEGAQKYRAKLPRGTFEELKLETTSQDCDGRSYHKCELLVTQSEALFLLGRHFGAKGWEDYGEDGLEATWYFFERTDEGFMRRDGWLFLASQSPAFQEES